MEIVLNSAGKVSDDNKPPSSNSSVGEQTTIGPVERSGKDLTADKECSNSGKSSSNHPSAIKDAIEVNNSKQFLAQNSTVIIQTICHTSSGKIGQPCSSVGNSCATAPDIGNGVEEDTTSEINHSTIDLSMAKTEVSKPEVCSEVDFAAGRSLLRYKCDKCGRECPSKHKLKRHLSTHSEARPFPCNICGRTFKWSEYLQKHMRQQHPLGKKSPISQTKCTTSKSKQSSVSTESNGADDEKVVATVVSEVQEYSASTESDICDSKKRDESRSDNGSNFQPATTVHDNKQQPEESNSLPFKQSVSIGVDMDAEEMDTEDSVVDLELDTQMSLQEAGSTSFAPNDSSSYSGQVTTVAGGMREVTCQSYDNGSITGPGNYHFTSPPLMDSNQYCTPIPCHSGNNESFTLTPHINTSSGFYEVLSGNLKSSCETYNSMVSTGTYSESSLNSGIMPQSNHDHLTMHMNVNSSVNCVDQLAQSNNSCPMLTPELMSNNQCYSTPLVSSNGMDIQNSMNGNRLDFLPTQYYNVDVKIQGDYCNSELNYVTNSMQSTASSSIQSIGVNQQSYDNSTYVQQPDDNSMNYESVGCGYGSVPHVGIPANSIIHQVCSNGGLSNTEHFTHQSFITSEQHHCMLPNNMPISESQQLVEYHQIQQENVNSSTNSDESTSEFVTMERIKIDVGIQCEVGPETLLALFMSAPEDDQSENDGRASESGNANSSETLSDDRLIQKYPCKDKNCNKAYIHRKDVIRHMRIRHGITPKKLEAVVVETPEKPHFCGVGCCRRSYFHMKDLKRHQRLCHQVNLGSKSNSNTSKVLVEDMCSDSDGTKTQMRYPCDFQGCLRSYVHKKDLVRHKRLFHKDSSSKPSIPVPVRYTDSELKQIRQKVKQEIDTKEQKLRLDSTGSNVSAHSSNEEECIENHNHVCVDETDCTILLSSSSSLLDAKSNVELEIDHPISSDVASILGALEQHSQQLFRASF